LYKKGNNSS